MLIRIRVCVFFNTVLYSVYLVMLIDIEPLETPVIDVLSVLRYYYSNVAATNYLWLRQVHDLL